MAQTQAQAQAHSQSQAQALGIFWGSNTGAAEKPREAARARSVPANADSAPGPLQAEREDSLFNASDTLGEVLERAVKRITNEIEKVKARPKAPFDPRHHAAPAKRFYPESVAQEHKDYFVLERERDALKSKVEKSQPSTILGKPSKTTERPWLSVLSKNEEDQVRYKFQTRIREKGKPFQKAANTKLQWVANSKRRADHRLRRLEHLLYLVQEEQRKDIRREIDLCACDDTRELRNLVWETARDRTEAADMLMRLLDDYKLISATEIGEYLLSGNVFFERQLHVPRTAPARTRRRRRSSRPGTAPDKYVRKQTPASLVSQTADLRETPSSAFSEITRASRPPSRAISPAPLWTQRDAQRALQRRQRESRGALEAIQTFNETPASQQRTRPATSATFTTRASQRLSTRGSRRQRNASPKRVSSKQNVL